jgi:hypothetical protein
MALAQSSGAQSARVVRPAPDEQIPAPRRTDLGRELARWSARNSSKGALVAESIKCLQFLAEGHSAAELHQVVQEQDLLAKRTWEARRTYWRLISWRYLTPADGPTVRALGALSNRGADDPVLRGALYFHFCLADRLTFDVATDLLWTLAEHGRAMVSPTEVESYIRARAATHPEVHRWSSTTMARLASTVLSALRDFGRLAGSAKKRLAQPSLPDELLVYVCKFLAAEGSSAREIVGASDFRLWGQTPQGIGSRLAKLSQCGVLRFEWSGDIAVLDLGEETFDAYARRLGQKAR